MDRSCSVTNLNSKRLVGPEIKSVLAELANLRMQIFFEYPYLYEGDLDYEMNYLSRYLKSSNSFFFGLWDQDQLIGATTGLPLVDEDPEFQKPFLDQNIDIKNIYYFGESLLHSDYRGQKIGHLFFDERENFAVLTHHFMTTCFCSVKRPENHPLKPKNYRSHHQFWNQRGYILQKDLIAKYDWKDRNENHESTKNLEFWTRDWKNEI